MNLFNCNVCQPLQLLLYKYGFCFPPILLSNFLSLNTFSSGNSIPAPTSYIPGSKFSSRFKPTSKRFIHLFDRKKHIFCSFSELCSRAGLCFALTEQNSLLWIHSNPKVNTLPFYTDSSIPKHQRWYQW